MIYPMVPFPLTLSDRLSAGGFGNLQTMNCELRIGELVICELIVLTTDANLGYNANQKVRTFYAVKKAHIVLIFNIRTSALYPSHPQYLSTFYTLEHLMDVQAYS